MRDDDSIEGASGEAVVKVLDVIRKNSTGYGNIEDNYLASIASELDMTRQRASRAVKLLEEHDMVRKTRKGRKKLLLLEGFDDLPDDRNKPIW